MRRVVAALGVVGVMAAAWGVWTEEVSGQGPAPGPAPQIAQGAVPGNSAQQAIEAAAQALGGAARLRAVRNITLQGYAQYAYQNGGGNISPLPGAPLKLIAANDYRRIFDVENTRMYHQERRNDLFPFANYGGHSFALARQGLDGAMAYAINAQGATNVGGDPRDRRMWFYTNPVTLVRAALTGAATAANRRQQDGLTLVDLTLREGDKLTLAIRPPQNMPMWISWIGPNQNLGEVTYTTSFFGYEPFNGVYLPMGMTTNLDWRNIEFKKLYVDGYTVDGQIPNLAATATFPAAPTGGVLSGPPPGGIQTLVPQVTPGQGRGGGAGAAAPAGGRGAPAAAGRAGGAPAAAPAAGRGGAPAGQQPVGVLNVARGVWRFAGGTMAIEFADHIVLYELNGGNARVHQVVEQAHQLVPGKRATHVVWSHHHFDHSSGVRQAVAEGLTIISRRDNGVIFREMTSRRAPNFPDDLERNFQPLKFVPVDDHLQLKDATMTMDIYHVIDNNHLAEGVLAYIPEHKIYIEADVLTAAEELQWWGDSFLANLAHRKLDVEKVVPVHMDIMTYEEAVRMVRPGIQRVKDYCAEMIAKGNWFPGCPAWVK
jgi:glyoxylase-like metal-dependent hydrolase (beta-lactamase superfamily II)